MINLKSLVIVFTGMIILSGCGGKTFPSYSGEYQLSNVARSLENRAITESSSNTDTFFSAEKSFPQKLLIDHRATPEGGGLNHFISFNFFNAGSFTESLTRILHSRQRVYFIFDVQGLPIAETRPGTHDSDACWVNYYYVVNIRFSPEPAVLNELYSLQEYVGRDQNQEPLYETLSSRQFAEKLPRESGLRLWEAQLQQGSVTVEFDLSRQAVWDLSDTGCSLRLHHDILSEAHIVATYRSTVLPGATSADLLTSGLELARQASNSYESRAALFRPLIGY